MAVVDSGRRTSSGKVIYKAAPSKYSTPSKSKSSGSSSSGRTVIVPKKTSEEYKAEALANQRAAAEKKKSSSSGSSGSSITPQQADTGSVSYVDIKTGQPTTAPNTQASDFMKFREAQNTTKPLTESQLISQEVREAQRIGTISNISSRGVTTSSNIAIARATVQAQTSSAQRKQEQIAQEYKAATTELTKKYGTAGAVNILMGKQQVSEEEAKPFYDIASKQTSFNQQYQKSLYLSQERERITTEKLKGIESQRQTIEKGRFTPFQKKQLESNYQKNIKSYESFTGTKISPPKTSFFSEVGKNISDWNVLATKNKDRGVMLEQGVTGKTQERIYQLEAKQQRLLQKQYSGLLPGSTKYKQTEKELSKVSKQIADEKKYFYRRQGASDWFKYQPVSVGLTVATGFAVGAAAPIVGAGALSVAGTSAVKLAAVKGGTLLLGAGLSGTYAYGTARTYGQIKDVAQRERFLGKEFAKTGTIATSGALSSKITSRALQPKISQEYVGKIESKQVSFGKGQTQQTFAQETRFGIKKAFSPKETVTVRSGGIETATKVGKGYYKTQGKIVSEISQPGKTTVLKSETAGRLLTKGKQSLAIKEITSKQGRIIEKTLGSKVKTDVYRQTSESFKLQGSKLKPQAIQTNVQKQISEIKYGDVTTREFTGASFGNKLKAKPISSQTSLGKTTGKLSFKSKIGSKIDRFASVNRGQTTITKTVKTLKTLPVSTLGQQTIIKSIITPKTVMFPSVSAIPIRTTQKQRTSQIPTQNRISSLRTNQFSIYKPTITRQIPRVGILTGQNIESEQIKQPIIGTTQSQKISTTQKQDVINVPTYNTVTPIVSIGSFGSFNTPNIPPPIIAPPLFFPSGAGGRQSIGYKGKGSKQLRALTPTARARIFNIKGKTTKGAVITGLGERYV